MREVKKDYLEVLRQLNDLGVDHVALACKLEQIRLMCISGVDQQKVSPKAAAGYVDLTERYPDVAARCVDLTFKIYQDALDRSESTSNDTEVNFSINIVPLETT